MDRYDFKSIEKKWQTRWEDSGVFHAEQPTAEHVPEKPKYYCLVEFPYPSGDGLPVGHPRSYTALGLVARKKRLEGWNVLYPMGWDAFGLPTENYAIATKIHPSIVTRDNISGRSGFFCNSINTVSPSKKRWRSTGVRRVFASSPMRRSSTGSVSAAAPRRRTRLKANGC